MAYPTTDEASLGTLVGQAAHDLSTLVRKEVELAKVEISDEVAKAGRGAGMFGGAGLAALYGVSFLLLAATFGLGAVLPLGWAALIVAGCCLAVAAALATTGRSTFRSMR